MKLASLKSGGRDGTLIVVNRALTRACEVPEIAPTLQAAIEDWTTTAPKLESIYARLQDDAITEAFDLNAAQLASPLPRAYHWVDASAYVNHVELVRKARGADMPDSFWTDPLVYQGASDFIIGPNDDIVVPSEEYGIDMEAETAVVLDDVPMCTSAEDAAAHIKLLMILNDVSLRKLIPAELAKGFGFYQGKGATAFSPVAVTPDELGDAWDGSTIKLPLVTKLNGELLGQPECGVDMVFNFGQLVQHVTKTRILGAGTILGSGTISNRDRDRGSSCLAEIRALEMIEKGEATTPFMSFGDSVRIEMFDADGASIFGAIDQQVTQLT